MGGPEVTDSKSATASIKALADESPNGAFDLLLSSAALDRDGETLLPDQWHQPFPDSVPINANHSSDVSDIVGSGRPWLDADRNLRVSGTFASTPAAQHLRSLVSEGHLRSVSVEFIRTKGANGPAHVLVGGAFVNVPSNPEARVLSAKAAAFSSAVRAVVEGKSFSDAEAAFVQAIHDASSHLGADCVEGIVGLDDDLTEDGEDGADDGSNKAAALRLRLKALSRA
jgi:hypothetical protein